LFSRSNVKDFLGPLKTASSGGGRERGREMSLTNKKIESLMKAGRQCRALDEKGLHLQVRGVNRASWILRYVSPLSGKTRELGLGAFERCGLAEARVKAAEAKILVSKGIDPVEAKKPAKIIAHASPTFGATAENFF
jgi:hypothetical protein